MGLFLGWLRVLAWGISAPSWHSGKQVQRSTKGCLSVCACPRKEHSSYFNKHKNHRIQILICSTKSTENDGATVRLRKYHKTLLWATAMCCKEKSIGQWFRFWFLGWRKAGPGCVFRAGPYLQTYIYHFWAALVTLASALLLLLPSFRSNSASLKSFGTLYFVVLLIWAFQSWVFRNA